MTHHITTAHADLTATLIERKDGYSTRYWTIQLSADHHLTRQLKHELAKAFGFIPSLTSFRSLVGGVVTLHEDLMN